MITQELVRELLDYNPDTGVFTWKPRSQEHAKRPLNWNSRYAGKESSTLNNAGYNVIRIHKKLYLAHRLAFFYVNGFMPEQVDHINGNRVGNRICNLRESDSARNSKNKKISTLNKSGHFGIYPNKKSGGWYVQIWSGGQYYGGGSHKCINSAIRARKALERKLGFYKEHGAR